MTDSGRSLMWPLGVFVILGTSFCVCGITIAFAVNDPSVAYEKDYYQRAVDWDDHARLRDASAELGWTAELSWGDAPEAARRLDLTLRMADGTRLRDAAVSAEMFHHARRGEPVFADFRQIAAGGATHSVILEDASPGLWQVRLRARRDADVFVRTLDIEAP